MTSANLSRPTASKVLGICSGDRPRTELGQVLGGSYELGFAATAAEAEARLGDFMPDAAVITRRPSPDEELELIGLVAACAPGAATIVVGRTSMPERIEAILAAGADTYLVEPLPPGQLYAALAAALRSHTARLAAGRSLSIYRERIEEMLQQAPIPMFVKDTTGRYQFTNDAFHEHVGVPREQVIGRLDRELIDPRIAVDLEEADRRVLAGEGPFEGEHELNLTGENRVYISNKFPFRDEEGRITGVVGIGTDVTERKRNDEVRSAAAIEQQRLIEQLQRSRAETVDRLTLALLKHDVASGEHVSRMAVIAAFLGELHGLGRDRVMVLRAAAPMHDVGKVGVADHILQKAGPLTMEERAEMERHARIGFEILDDSGSETLQLGAIIALTHHENWDGSGYPRALRGIEIPLEGRICAVADVFDALLSDRPYRAAMSPAAAREIIAEGRGRFFDPEVVDLLLDNFAEACRLRERGRGPMRLPIS